MLAYKPIAGKHIIESVFNITDERLQFFIYWNTNLYHLVGVAYIFTDISYSKVLLGFIFGVVNIL